MWASVKSFEHFLRAKFFSTYLSLSDVFLQLWLHIWLPEFQSHFPRSQGFHCKSASPWSGGKFQNFFTIKMGSIIRLLNVGIIGNIWCHFSLFSWLSPFFDTLFWFSKKLKPIFIQFTKFSVNFVNKQFVPVFRFRIRIRPVRNYFLGLLGEEFSIGPLGPLRECRWTSSLLLHVVLHLVLHLGGYGLVTLVVFLD